MGDKFKRELGEGGEGMVSKFVGSISYFYMFDIFTQLLR